jgi:hypothetical protein
MTTWKKGTIWVMIIAGALMIGTALVIKLLRHSAS